MTDVREQYLNCKSLLCPIPIVQISRAYNSMSDGERLRVDASDPAFRADLEAWLEVRGAKLVEFTGEGPEQQAVIEKMTAEGRS